MVSAAGPQACKHPGRNQKQKRDDQARTAAYTHIDLQVATSAACDVIWPRVAPSGHLRPHAHVFGNDRKCCRWLHKPHVATSGAPGAGANLWPHMAAGGCNRDTAVYARDHVSPHMDANTNIFLHISASLLEMMLRTAGPQGCKHPGRNEKQKRDDYTPMATHSHMWLQGATDAACGLI